MSKDVLLQASKAKYGSPLPSMFTHFILDFDYTEPDQRHEAHNFRGPFWGAFPQNVADFFGGETGYVRRPSFHM
jgi:hypothetical protein